MILMDLSPSYQTTTTATFMILLVHWLKEILIISDYNGSRTVLRLCLLKSSLWRGCLPRLDRKLWN